MENFNSFEDWCNTKKNRDLNKLKSLFEIRRPTKNRSLQRTNSLPPTSTPLYVLEQNSSKKHSNGIMRIDNKVQKIVEQLEVNQNNKYQIVNDKELHHNEVNLTSSLPGNRKATLMSDVTKYLEDSDAECEICSKTITVSNDDLSDNAGHLVERLYVPKYDENKYSVRNASEDSLWTGNGTNEKDSIKSTDEIDVHFQTDSYKLSMKGDEDDAGDDKYKLPFWEQSKSFIHTNKRTISNPNAEKLKNDAPEQNFLMWKFLNGYPRSDHIPEEEKHVKHSRYIKNGEAQNKKQLKRKLTGISRKKNTVREIAQGYEGFNEAERTGQRDLYRKQVLDEMDEEITNMKKDGFEMDVYTSMESLSLNNDLTDNESGASEKCGKGNRKEENEYYIRTIFIPKYPLQKDYQEAEETKNEVNLNDLEEKELTAKRNFLEAENSLPNEFDNDEHASSNATSLDSGSKRTTMYSTSSVCSSEDEGLEAYQNPYNARKRETFCDANGEVRIERVISYTNIMEKVNEHPASNSNFASFNPEEVGDKHEDNEVHTHIKVKKNMLQYIIEEIKVTEVKYIDDIMKVISDYKDFLKPIFDDAADVIFGNLEEILSGHVKFLAVLEDSGEDINKILEAIVKFENLFKLYPKYLKNTPRANAVVKELSSILKERQEELQEKFNISAYLLRPLQRLGKYKLFLESIIKQLEKGNKPTTLANKALGIIKKYMRKGNDAVAIASILHSVLKYNEYGSFIMREKFTLVKPKRMELMVFLFENVVVFTTEAQADKEQFEYWKNIKTTDLRLATFEDTTLHLTDFTKSKRWNSQKHTYILDAKNDKVKALWKGEFEKILWTQLIKEKEKSLKDHEGGNLSGKWTTSKGNTLKSRTLPSYSSMKKAKGNSHFYT